MGWKDMTKLGFGKGFEGLKGLRVHSHSKGAGMEDEVSRALAREDAGVVCFLGGDWRVSNAFSMKARALLTDEALSA